MQREVHGKQVLARKLNFSSTERTICHGDREVLADGILSEKIESVETLSNRKKSWRAKEINNKILMYLKLLELINWSGLWNIVADHEIGKRFSTYYTTTTHSNHAVIVPIKYNFQRKRVNSSGAKILPPHRHRVYNLTIQINRMQYF